MHDIGIIIRKDATGTNVYDVWVGGGQGRTPIIGQLIGEGIAAADLLAYLEATMRVYTQHGRRDNIYKARIKILVKSLGAAEFKRQVEEEWVFGKNGPNTLTEAEVARVAGHFTTPAYASLPADDAGYVSQRAANPAFAAWTRRNVLAHKVPGYAVVVLSLKNPSRAPGDVTAEQLDLVADWADAHSFGEVRATHEQNLVLADVKQSELFAVWEKARAAGLATPTFGLLTDLICCPGGDFCALANAKSIPIANAIQARFDDLDYLYDIGDIELNISGCMNSCGHHHVGHIGILGVDKNGEEWYQVSLGGSQGNRASIGKVIGRSFAAAEMPGVIAKIIDVYLAQRQAGERFIETVRRTGLDPFKLGVYGDDAVKERKQNA